MSPEDRIEEIITDRYLSTHMKVMDVLYLIEEMIEDVIWSDVEIQRLQEKEIIV